MSTDGPPFAQCVINDDFGLFILSVVHSSNPGSTGAHYRVSRCNSTLLWLADYFNFANTTGDSRFGVTVDYDDCLAGTILVQTIAFFGDRTSPANSALKIMPGPNSTSGLVEALACDGTVIFPEPGGICIKPVTCYCNYLGPPYHGVPCFETVPAAESTWGTIKALYDE
jgi:hypothetical protein